MDPQVLSEVWNLASTVEAHALLGGVPSTLGATVVEVPQTPRANTTVQEVAADTTSLDRLAQARNRIVTNAAVVVQNNAGGEK